jgi:hypothetical protein
MALRLIYQMFSNPSLFQRPSTWVGRRGGYCVELSLRRERPADYLDFRSSSATDKESDMGAPIWSPNDQLVIFKWISDASTKSRLRPINAGRAVSDIAGHRPRSPRRDDLTGPAP